MALYLWAAALLVVAVPIGLGDGRRGAGAAAHRWPARERSSRLAVASPSLVATATAGARRAPETVTITIHYSAFDARTALTCPRGVPVTFVLVNEDPIDHEWLIGDEAFHGRGTGRARGARGRAERGDDPGARDAATTITFDEPGTFQFICHLPGHEAYGMVGTLTVEG